MVNPRRAPTRLGVPGLGVLVGVLVLVGFGVLVAVGAGVICPACGDVAVKVRASYAVEANRVLDRFILAGVYSGELLQTAVQGVVEGRHHIAMH